MDSIASRFIEELPEKYLERNSFFDENKNEIDDFEFNQDQDYDNDDNIRSPGWIDIKKESNDKKKNRDLRKKFMNLILMDM